MLLTDMAFLVPYDGSRVAQAALDRAVTHGKALDEKVVAVSFVPTGTEYVQRRKWIEPDDDFAVDTAREALHRKIEEATDTAERTFDESGASAPHDGVSEDIRQVAEEVGATVLFVGTSDESENGQLETPFGPVAPNGSYDVHLVRTT